MYSTKVCWGREGVLETAAGMYPRVSGMWQCANPELPLSWPVRTGKAL